MCVCLSVSLFSQHNQTAVSLPSGVVAPFVCCWASLMGAGTPLPFSAPSGPASWRFKFSLLPLSGPSLPSFSLMISPGFSSSMRACDSPSPTVRRPPKEAFTQNTGWGGRTGWWTGAVGKGLHKTAGTTCHTHTHNTDTPAGCWGLFCFVFFCVFWGIDVQWHTHKQTDDKS